MIISSVIFFSLKIEKKVELLKVAAPARHFSPAMQILNVIIHSFEIDCLKCTSRCKACSHCAQFCARSENCQCLFGAGIFHAFSA